MSNRRDIHSLHDIQEAASRIESYTAGMTYATFLEDSKTQDAVIRNLEIIGEATKNLSTEFRERYSAVPWQEMARLRDRLIHHYFGINLDIVWQIISAELPDVALDTEAIIRNMN